MRPLLIVLSLSVTLLTLVLSWLPSSRMSDVPWLPDPIGVWADQDPDQRTAVPLMIAGFVFTLVAERVLQFRAPFAIGMSGSLVLLGMAELGQFFLPARGPALGDLVWGGLGAFVGALAATHLSRWWHRVRSPSVEAKDPYVDEPGSDLSGR